MVFRLFTVNPCIYKGDIKRVKAQLQICRNILQGKMKKKPEKKVLAVITGIGYGHSIREAAILDKLKGNNYDIIVAGYSNSYNYFEFKYDTLELHGPKFIERKFKFSVLQAIFKNLLLPFKHLINLHRLKRVCKIFEPDIIIGDFEPSSLSIAKKKPHLLVFNFDPEIYEEYCKENNKKFRLQHLYINHYYEKAFKKNIPLIVSSISGKSGKKESNKICYVNPIIRELPDKKTNVLKGYKDPIIISLGGSYFGSEILERLLNILPEFENDFIIFSYKTIGKSEKNIHFFPFKENFLEYINSSKAIIAFCGHNTISEAIVLKKPCLVFPVPNYIEQVLNAYELEKTKLGMGKTLKYPLDNEEIKSSIKDFFKKIPEIQENLNSIDIKGNGAEQVYEIIKEISK